MTLFRSNSLVYMLQSFSCLPSSLTVPIMNKLDLFGLPSLLPNPPVQAPPPWLVGSSDATPARGHDNEIVILFASTCACVSDCKRLAKGPITPRSTATSRFRDFHQRTPTEGRHKSRNAVPERSDIREASSACSVLIVKCCGLEEGVRCSGKSGGGSEERERW